MSHVDNPINTLLVRLGVLLWLALYSVITPTLAETPAAGKAPADQSTEATLASVEADLAAARGKQASGPSRPLTRLVAEGIATPDEQDEWKLLLNLRIASLEKHLDALRNHQLAAQSRQELKTQAEAWTGFAQPPPYSIDFIDELWGRLIALQQDLEAAQIARNLMSSQVSVLRSNLGTQQKAARQAAEQVERPGEGVTPEQARLRWLSELAGERVLTTLTTLQQYEAMLQLNSETLASLQLKGDLLQRQIEAATLTSPLTQADLDSKLARNSARQTAFEEELREAIAREQQAQENVREARAELLKRQADAVEGNAADKARIEFAQAMLDVRKAQVETAVLRQEALRLLLDATRGVERIWRARFEVAHKPGLERLREMRATLADVGQRINLWKQYLANSLEAAEGLTAAAEKRLARSERDSPERTIAEATIDAYQERKALYERVQTEINDIRLLLLRWEQEVRAQDRTASSTERFQDLLNRLAGAAVDLWNLEVFEVQDTIEVDGRKITGTRSVTVGKVATVILILTLGLWLAARASAWISQMLRSRLDMSRTAATLLERGLYILSIIVLILIALDIVNIPLTVFAFLGGALAIGIGFGAQTLINNFISGLILLVERPISLGDLVEVEGVRGRVSNIGARCSRIHRADGIDMLVPNSAFLEKNVTNLTLTDNQLRMSVKVGVAYGTALREVTRLLKEAVTSHGKVLKDPEPLILFEDFGDNALMFAADFWVNVTPQSDSRVVASDLRFMIERLFRDAGIVIAYPQRDVHLDQTRPLEVVVRSDGAAGEQTATP